jgi:hypothetical protein
MIGPDKPPILGDNYFLGGTIKIAISTGVSAIVALSLAACSAPSAAPQDGATGAASTSTTASAPSSSSAQPAAQPTAKYKLSTAAGAEIAFTLPTPATDPAVKSLEAFRVKAGGAPVAYLVADVDNRKGTESVNMYMVSAFDADGIQYTFSTVTDAIDAWRPTYQADGTYQMPNGKVLTDAAGSPLSSQAGDLYNANIHDADKGERTKIILQSPIVDLPKEFTRVSVQPSGAGEGEDASPATS